MEPVPIANFDFPPVKLWVAHNLRCAIYWGFASFNGYVQLPEGHVDRVIAEAYNDFEHNDDDRRDRRSMTLRDDQYIGYDILRDVHVHGGLTYGPDKEGWLGFDTGHAGDDWSDEDIERYLRPIDEESWLKLREYQLVLGEDSWPPGRMLRGHTQPGSFYHLWTMEALIAETDHLAEQIDHRRGVLVTNGAT